MARAPVGMTTLTDIPVNGGRNLSKVTLVTDGGKAMLENLVGNENHLLPPDMGTIISRRGSLPDVGEIVQVSYLI